MSNPQLPEWKCHKIVRGAKIIGIPMSVRHDPELGIVHDFVVDLGDGVPTPFAVKPAVVNRYFPVVGDYVVVYQGGYVSVSPRAEFEDGYTRQ